MDVELIALMAGSRGDFGDQREMRTTAGHEHPCYWAPFVVVGDVTSTE